MICPQCQSLNPDAARFCSNCGRKFEAQPARRAAEGERKLVTVLFADVVGSTAMGEWLDPEQVTDLMNGAFAFLNQAVARYGGTVVRLMGDAVLALFGAPAAHEDDPERAVRAGLEMQAAAGQYAAEVKRKYGVDFHVRVGIHTGLAVLDQVGDNIRAEYTAMGDTPNVAARMQSAAVPGTVLVSADTYRLARHAFDFEPRGALEVKGKAAPVEAWQAVGVKAVRGTVRGLEGLSAPLIGRAAELGRLQARLRDLQPGGAGAMLAVVGEAGLGKSRLLAEAQAWAGRSLPPGMAWLEGRCVSYGQSISYHPWRQIIRQSIGAAEGDSHEAVRSKLEYTACECCRMPGGDQPFLEAMLAVASEESLKTVMGYSGEALVERMTEAVRGYLCAWAQMAPQVIVFEDLHWADESSIDLLYNLCDVALQYPLLMVCLARPEPGTSDQRFFEPARQKLGPAFEEIALQPLPVDQSRDLLAHLLHIEELPDTVRALILEKSEGNPFFVEEVIRSLLDGGYIVREAGHWRATRDIVRVVIPNTLAGLLAARIDALPEEAKRVAQMSAVLGRTFALRVLKAVCDAAPAAERIADIQSPLARLVAEDVLHEGAAEPELEYTFKHALTQEAAYNSLLLRRRREFHGRAGAALEALNAGRLAELAPDLAHHFRQAEDWSRAAQYAQQAGDAALSVYALRDAISYYDQAIDAQDKLSGADPEMIFASILAWSRAAFKFRPYPEQLERLGRAEQIARSVGDKRRLAEALNAIGAVHEASGHNLRATASLAEAFALAEELGDEALSVGPSFHAAFVRMDSDPQGAVLMFDKAIALARKYGRRPLEAYAQGAKGIALARLGRFAESEEAARTALEIVYTLGSPVAESDVELFAGWAYLGMGDTPRGLEHGRRGVEQAIATDNFDCICGGLACVGFGQMAARQLPEAADSFANAIRQSKTSGAIQFEVLARGGKALAELAGGHPEAVAELEQAKAQAFEIHENYPAAIFGQALAEAYLSLGDLAAAEKNLAPALDYFRRNEMQVFLAGALKTEAALREKAAQK